MPVARYFICVGSLLLALLFFLDRNDPSAAPAPRAEVDRSILRIKSAQRWPERIVFDTSTPPPTALLAVPVVAARVTAAPDSGLRQALAMVPTVASAVEPAVAGKPPPRVRRSRLARHRMAPVASFRQADVREASPFGF
jgi:hypothetical protein